MTAKTVANLISIFGAAAKAKLTSVAITGAPEDQLRGPLETLFHDIAAWAGLAKGALHLVGETSIGELHIRPDYAVSVNNALVGFIAAIETGVPFLVQARTLIDRFHAMIRKRTEVELDPWITEARTSLIASFATGIGNDRTAVHAAITEPWSNGQTEGQITKLKLVKRQMYGRAKIDLLQARVIGAP